LELLSAERTLLLAVEFSDPSLDAVDAKDMFCCTGLAIRLKRIDHKLQTDAALQMLVAFLSDNQRTIHAIVLLHYWYDSIMIIFL
jgi:hypothetical protein